MFHLELADVCNNLGTLAYSRRHFPAEALDWHLQAVATAEPVLAKEPQRSDARGILRCARAGRALALDRLARHAEAFRAWGQALTLADDSSRPTLLLGRSQSLARLGDHTRAAADTEAVLRSGKPTADQLYHAAFIYALSAGQVTQDAPGSPKARDYADRAMARLKEAIRNGLRDVERLKNEPALDALRPREDFQKLLREYDRPTKP